MKNKICYLPLLTLILLSGCGSNKPTSSSSTSSIVDNYENSLVHDPIYLYGEDNVPYDDDNDTRPFVFLTPYLAAKPTGGAVVVFPGGGYTHLSNSTNNVAGYGKGVDNQGNQKESSDIASFYNEQGISVFVLNYRTTAVDSKVDYRYLLSDATRAIKYVRYNASNYYVSPNKIAVQGYSAGGHLASMMLNHYDFTIDDANYKKDEIDDVSAKADLGVLCYSVLSFDESITHKGTRSVFTRDDESLYDEYSSIKSVTKDTAPCFLWCHMNDGTVNSANTLQMAEALTNAGVENEYYTFDDNGTTDHGIGIAKDYEEASEWPSLATDFLKAHNF